MSVLAHRQTMHGPLWIANEGRTRVQLWAPNDERDHWALCWTTTDDDDEVVDTDYLTAPHMGEFPALVPTGVQRPVGAVLNAATAWNPQERCDHARATSFGILDNGRRVCGYCGRVVRP